jgi:hypothetical protein
MIIMASCKISRVAFQKAEEKKDIHLGWQFSASSEA